MGRPASITLEATDGLNLYKNKMAMLNQPQSKDLALLESQQRIVHEEAAQSRSTYGGSGGQRLGRV